MVAPQKVLYLHLEEEKKNPKIFGDYIVSEKINGWYCFADYDYYKDSWSYVTSSALRSIPSFFWAKGIFESLPKPKESCRLIMEAIIPGMEFEEMNGRFNRSVGEYSCRDVVFNIHDYIPLATYFKTLDVKNFAIERYKTLCQLDTSCTNGVLRIHPILGISSSKDIWQHYFDEITSQGGEGIVLKQVDSLYVPGKRNSSLMKMKEEITLDLLCTGAYRTIGEKGYENINLIFTQSAGPDVHVRLAKHSDIDLFEKDDANFVGRIGEVKAMKIIKGTKALKEPRFVRIREDKVEGE